jgi:hypothetical protein
MIREFRTRRRARAARENDEQEAEEESEEQPAQLPESSIQDLVQPADVQAFDQTFTDAGAELDVEGEFEPVAGDKQVIPRIAYVLNYNLIYNEAQERWEPQEGNENGGAGSGSGVTAVSVLEKTSDQSIPTNNTFAQVSFQQSGPDTLGAAAVSSNQFTAPATGVYECNVALTYISGDSGADLDHKLRVNGTEQSSYQTIAAGNISGLSTSIGFSKVLELSASDAVTISASGNLTSTAEIEGSPDASYISLKQLSA